MKKLLICGTGLSRRSKPGMAIPAETLYEEFCKMDLDFEVQLLGFESKTSVDANRSFIEKASIVIINSLSTLLQEYSADLLQLLKGKKAFIYLHETEYVLEYSELTNSDRMTGFWRFFKAGGAVLCSTKKQMQYYQSLGVKHASVIYNSMGFDERYSWMRNKLAAGSINIIMIGSIQKRKGPELFDAVANLAKQSHSNLNFTWIGGPTEREGGDYKFSSSVTWKNKVKAEEIYDLYAESDLFFLSSLDDPLPLAATEAAAAGLKIIAYDKTGTAETLAESLGFCAFSEYSPDAAFDAIEKITAKDGKTDYTSAKELFDPPSFARRALSSISALLQEMPNYSHDQNLENLPLKPANLNNKLYGSALCAAMGMAALQVKDHLHTNSSSVNKSFPSFGDYKSIFGRHLLAYEVLALAKLFILQHEHEKAISIIASHLNELFNLRSSISLVTLAMDNYPIDLQREELISRLVLPRFLTQIKMRKSQEAVICAFIGKLLFSEGYECAAQTYQQRASDLGFDYR